MSAGLRADRHESPAVGPSVFIRSRRGIDLGVRGRVAEAGPAPAIRHVALCGDDYAGLKPRLLVAPGDPVRAGQPLFLDRRDPAVKFTAPGSGTVVAVNRGARRALLSVVIRLDADAPARLPLPGGARQPLDALGREDIVALLAESGWWTAFRTRPFSRVPRAGSEPAAIFVTAIDTQPLAADPLAVIEPGSADFAAGLRVVARLTRGTVWLCTAPGWRLGEPDVPRLRRAVFDGPHPAGLPGTHMHALEPVGESRTAWHIGYQDVMAIGRLVTVGELDFSRVVAVADAAGTPRLVRSRLGAALDELAGRAAAGADCPVSGSLLTGRVATAETAYLGRYHLQVSAPRGQPRPRRFGWLWPGRGAGHASCPAATAPGRPTGMLPLERFDELLPDGFLAVPLLRALMAGDAEQARALGCLELDEEDLALCAWACPARCDYGGALRSVLRLIEREG